MCYDKEKINEEIKEADYYFNNSTDDMDHKDGSIYVDTKTANEAIDVFTNEG